MCRCSFSLFLPTDLQPRMARIQRITRILIFNSQFAACRTCFAHRLHRLTQIFVLFDVSGVFGNIKSRCRCSFVMGRCDISEVAKHHILGRNYSNYFNFFPIKAHRCSCRHGGYFTGRHGSLPLQSGTIMLQRQCCYTERAMILYGKSIAPRAVGQCSMGYKSSASWGIMALLYGVQGDSATALPRRWF